MANSEELLQISKEIKTKIELLESMRKVVKDRGDKKAIAISEYEKIIAITIIELKNGIEKELDGRVIKNPPITIIDKIAKGICYKEKHEMEKYAAMYKSAIINIQTVSIELNALQSIFRHLDVI